MGCDELGQGQHIGAVFSEQLTRPLFPLVLVKLQDGEAGLGSKGMGHFMSDRDIV